MKVVLTGGGTGGHIFPLIAVAREFKKNENNLELFYCGPKDSFSREAFESENIVTYILPSGKIRRYFSLGSIFKNIIDIFFKIPFGIIKAWFLLKKIKPDFIFSKGGYGSAPIIIAGKLLSIPIYLHESDSIAGTANKITGMFAKKIFVSFPIEKVKNIPHQKMTFTGNPIRESLTQGNIKDAREKFGLLNVKPILLVLGGSQGSTRINSIIIENLDYLLENFEIIHQTGKVDYKRILKFQRGGYHIYDFLNEKNMADALKCCSLVISRSGSGSIFEISANEKPSILIPLPESAQNHQVYNAKIYEQEGACIVIEENKLTNQLLVSSIRKIINSDSYITAAKAFSRYNSSQLIVKEILELHNNSKNDD
ncbi:undecaprenyldiphospho-muramoylpentapeptide beta-N-acetylglucosaminyltransferase [bacterium]|nr:undecaprenyldiphospho-muramoylpentapeptide beta-N-acetylglucosaminyltransferase [bacterium]